MRIFPYVACLIAAVAAAQRRPAARPQPLSLQFGVYTSDKASVMLAQFAPVIRALEPALRAETGREVRIRLKIVNGYQKALDALLEGEIDFARFGPASYVIAKDRSTAPADRSRDAGSDQQRERQGVRLLAMETKKGAKRFHGVIVVRAGSDIRRLADLAGRRFAFGDENSTIGRFLAQAELYDHGLHVSDLAKFAFLGRHDKVAKAVELGDFDAGSIKESTLRRMSNKTDLRVLHRFENVTKPWLARPGMPDDVVRALRSALLGLKDPDALKALKVSGFVPATDADYDFVRKGIARARLFEAAERVAPPSPPRRGR